jgi:hypothetical protein
MLLVSNSRATRASYLVGQDLGRSDFQLLYSMVRFSSDQLFSIVTAPGPLPKLDQPCKFCLSVEEDLIDRFCPRDKCGPKAGSYPMCVDSTKLFAANFSCRDRYPIYMDRLQFPSRQSTASFRA